jgi:hypothetical protein
MQYTALAPDLGQVFKQHRIMRVAYRRNADEEVSIPFNTRELMLRALVASPLVKGRSQP